MKRPGLKYSCMRLISRGSPESSDRFSTEITTFRPNLRVLSRRKRTIPRACCQPSLQISSKVSHDFNHLALTTLFGGCRLSSEGWFYPGSRRIKYAAVVDTGSDCRDCLVSPSSHCPPARPVHCCCLHRSDGGFQPRAGLAAAGLLGVDCSRCGPIAAARPAAQVLQRAAVQLVPENPAADVTNRTRRHRRRHRVVGRRIVQRPSGLEQIAVLSKSPTD